MQLIGPLLSQGNKSMLFVWVAVIGLILLTLIRNTSYIEMNIYVLIWLLAYLWFMQQQTASAAGFKMAVSEVLVWLFIFSASISTVIIAENKKIELEQRKSSAEKLASLADRSGEKLISIALRYLDDEFLSANFSRFYDESSNLYLKDSIISSNFNVYTSRYNTRMFTFDSSSKVPRGLFNTIVGSFDTLNTIWRSAKITDIPELHYYEKSFDKFSYICRRTITNEFGTLQGYIFIELMPKEHKSDALEPELFKNQKDSYVENGQNYTYAIYNDGMLKNHSNSYSFPLRLTAKEIPRLETELRRNKGYDEFWYRDNNKVVVIARQHNYTLEAITLFAWIFTTFLILLGLFRLIAILIQTRLKLSLLKQYFQLNLRSQIHGTFISITLLSFVVIGITTIVFFIGRYERNNRNRLSKAIQIMNKQVEAEIKRSETFDDMVKFYQAGANNRLMEMVERVSEIHGADINFYDLNGKLVVPSNPIIYNKGVLSAWMSPQAYHELKRNRVVEFINKEQMGDISYQSIYCPVRDAQGKPYAYLNIPSFDSQDELKKEISNFFVTIINLTAFIFLIAGAVALVITNRITSSFTMIVNKMQAINLGKDNEEIPWDRDDEIGGLVKEYNKMVNKLEASAAQLAKSEREGAWREMARQVAHEIKNPLTPMKLSIQYLQKAIASNTPNVKELTANVASTLVEQIDHLARIAADFSQFANIGNPKNEKFDLHDLLQSLSLLYATNDKLEFTWKRVEQPVIIMADKTQLNRLFTNLLQNAAEACQNQFIRRVLITESLNGNYITIVISDNGEGIPTAVQEKIFTPNFTTKTSGTGLGLAMSKSIVEQAKGEIWFTTKEGIGSNFFVKLPVIKST
jgi:signal transduction histidine kinase